jgi:hypothetical protein
LSICGLLKEETEQQAAKRACGRPSQAVRGPVAEILNMGGKCTPRSIAYICVLVGTLFSSYAVALMCSSGLFLAYGCGAVAFPRRIQGNGSSRFVQRGRRLL